MRDDVGPHSARGFLRKPQVNEIMRVARRESEALMSLEISNVSLPKIRENIVEPTDDALTTERLRCSGKAYSGTIMYFSGGGRCDAKGTYASRRAAFKSIERRGSLQKSMAWVASRS